MASSPSDRDRMADERDRMADKRDRDADKRDRDADERDRQAEGREGSAPAAATPPDDAAATAAGLFGIDLGHRWAPTDEPELVDDEPPPVKVTNKTLTERLATAAADRNRAPRPPIAKDDKDDNDDEDPDSKD